MPIGGAGPVVVNEFRNVVYVMRRGNNGEITVINGSRNWYSITTESYVPDTMAVNQRTDRLYVSHPVSGDVRAVDTTSTSDHPPSVSIQIPGKPGPLAINSNSNRIYVSSNDIRAPVTVIDGASNTPVYLDTGGHGGTPYFMAVNPTNNRAYASFTNEIIVVDGANNALSFIPTSAPATAMAVEPNMNKVYALVGTRTLLAIDGATQNVISTQLPIDATAIAVDPLVHRLFVAGANGVAVYDVSAAAPNPSLNYQGLWWSAPAGSESGWGLNIAHQGGMLFGAWFTYDEFGNTQWYVVPGMNRQIGESYGGTLYRVTGPPYTAAAFDTSKVVATVVGFMSIGFADTSHATMQVTINDARITKAITRQVFGPLPTCGPNVSAAGQPNYTDLWWNSPAGSESGWGIFITHQGDNAFVVWYTYDVDGRGTWFVGNAVRNGAVYSGTFYRTTGPPFTASPWESARVGVNPVGTITLSFSDANNAMFSYSVAGKSGFKAITREAFASPPTVCR